ncbi:NUDIX domain-containing protein [Nonomuraea sp. SYSU D8015]|uniref:NUDIX domain-containing protein n=1 Tax=Nonomuraea sp. SYSU D8015 TaxID=2593644 RepID=UPI00166034CF|nr:NUDIX hydrolase [Nonomuraea sp. SYSU D8015]
MRPDFEHPIRQISTNVAYKSPYMRLREDRIVRLDGSEGVYTYVDKPDFALVIAVEDGGFHLVEQYRYPVRSRSWEFVQGSLPGLTAGEPESLARRELLEETGITATAMRHLGRLNCATGMSSQGFDVFVASELSHGEAAPELEEQDLRCRWFSRADFEGMIRDGSITDGSTLAAYTLFLLHTPPA